MPSEGVAVDNGVNVSGRVPKVVQLGRNVMGNSVFIMEGGMHWVLGDDSLDLGHIGLSHVARALPFK